MIEIIPGIQENNWPEMERKLQLVAPYAPWVQIDISDGTLLPYSTFLDFSKFTPFTKKISLEAHLMVVQPEKYIRQLADAGFQRLIAHVESNEPRLFLDQAAYESVEVVMALDGESPIEDLEPFLEEVDGVLLMTYEIGPSGRPFDPLMLEKLRILHQNLPDLPIEVDGGINDQTAKLVKDAGATRIVSTSYLFKDPVKITEAIERLRNA